MRGAPGRISSKACLSGKAALQHIYIYISLGSSPPVHRAFHGLSSGASELERSRERCLLCLSFCVACLVQDLKLPGMQYRIIMFEGT